jgi:hypothetical protein
VAASKSSVRVNVRQPPAPGPRSFESLAAEATPSYRRARPIARVRACVRGLVASDAKELLHRAATKPHPIAA